MSHVRLALAALLLSGCVDLGRTAVDPVDASPADAKTAEADAELVDRGPEPGDAQPADAATASPDRGVEPDAGADLDQGIEPDAEGGPLQCGDCIPGEVRPCGVNAGVCTAAEQQCVDGCWRPCPGLAEMGPETCDARDEDCDGVVDEGLGLGEPCEVGVGGCAMRGTLVCTDAGETACDAAPGAPSAEVCNGIDDDCDGVFDEALECPDCRDDEVCNGLDDDCDERVDEGLLNACGECGLLPPEQCDGIDQDCDGQADEGLLNACGACGPTPMEVCDGRDDDCDGQIDEGVLNACGACGAAPMEACNGRDDDCDGQIDEGLPCDAPEVCDGLDQDQDGQVDEGLVQPCGTSNVGQCRLGTQTCEGGEWGACDGAVAPAAEVCNDRDDDCDGAIDEAGACAGVAERCDGIDQDLDGQIDEGVEQACGASAVGACRLGVQQCQNGVWGACVGARFPQPESCNAADDDCDGQVDEGVVQLCGSNVGSCRRGQQHCSDGRWGVCEGEIGPSAESCNGADDDCDGRSDEHVQRACGSDVGACRPGISVCDDAQWGPCNDQGPSRETCNGIDDDCDGMVDEEITRECGSNVGICQAGSQACINGGWGVCNGGVLPQGEQCNGLDDDCDGRTDERLGGGACLERSGFDPRCISEGIEVCVNGRLECDAPPPEGSPERCDGEDNDCDARIDEGFPGCIPP